MPKAETPRPAGYHHGSLREALIEAAVQLMEEGGPDNVSMREAAKRAGAAEAWLVDRDGLVTEGSSTNAWIVDADGVLRTRDTGANILRGITRAAVSALAAERQIRFEERPFTVGEAKGAREAFYTAASAFVTPVISIDGARIGDGKPGPVTQALRAAYLEQARALAV